MIALKINITTQDYYSQPLIAQCKKLKLKIFMKLLAQVCFMLIIQLSQNIMMIQTN